VSEPPPTGALETRDDGAQAAAVVSLRLTISLFGGISLRLGGREIAIPNRKAKALLGYLAFTPTMSATREQLVGLLWSESDEGRARANLRQVLRALRAALARNGFAGFLTDWTDVALEPGSIKLDVAGVLDSVAAGRPHDLLLDHQGLTDTLMAGYEDIDPEFCNWLRVKRGSLHKRVALDLESALRDGGAAQSGMHERTARALLNLDPTHEVAARALIRARADAGDIGGALRIYNSLWEVLVNEHDTEPSKPTQELIAKVKLEQPLDSVETAALPGARSLVAKSLPAVPASLTAEPKLVVSVTEFDASSVAQEQRYLVQGFRSELIACLVRFREWLVCDQATGFMTPVIPGRPVGEFVIEASAFQVADGVRLVLMLREVATNAYLWSERFQISIANWFDAQQSVVRRLAIALNVYLSAERMATIASRPATNLRANDLWLLGQAAVLNVDPRNWERARDFFRQVIAQMPDFAPAYSSLAQLNNAYHLAMPGVFRDPSRMIRLIPAASSVSAGRTRWPCNTSRL